MPKSYVGIDIAKEKFDLFRLHDGLEETFANNATGIRKCLECLGAPEEYVVVMEATGGYERLVSTELQAAGFAVAIVNPARIRNFAKACGQLAKTDAIDARIIAHYASVLKPPARGVLDSRLCTLKDLVARRHQLLGMRTAENNRIHHAFDKSVRRSINVVMKALERELEKVEVKIRKHIDETPEFQEKKDIIKTVPGVGDITASMLIAELPELGHLNRRQIAALVGLAPINRDSGQFRGKRMTGGGRRNLRSRLFMPTLVAVQHNPIIREFYLRLLDRGKSKMTALVAAMRKLLIILNSLVSKKEVWNPNMP